MFSSLQIILLQIWISQPESTAQAQTADASESPIQMSNQRAPP